MLTGLDKTRLDKPDKAPPLRENSAAVPKGVVDPRGAAGRIRLATLAPSAPLSRFVEYFWIVEWDRHGQPPARQRVLPYPNAHLVFEPSRSAIHGVVRGAFERVLEGRGSVLGVRFYPGGLRPWLDAPLSTLTDTTAPAGALLRGDTASAAQPVLEMEEALVDAVSYPLNDAAGDAALVARADTLLCAALPPPDPMAELTRQAVAAAAAERGPTSVAALCAALALDERRLQRLFREYVGVTPKWVIQRYRLQEAIWHLGQDPAHAAAVDLADLAARLGFFDQAHFTRQFTTLVGQSPRDYWLSQRRPVA